MHVPPSALWSCIPANSADSTRSTRCFRMFQGFTWKDRIPPRTSKRKQECRACLLCYPRNPYPYEWRIEESLKTLCHRHQIHRKAYNFVSKMSPNGTWRHQQQHQPSKLHPHGWDAETGAVGGEKGTQEADGRTKHWARFEDLQMQQL